MAKVNEYFFDSMIRISKPLLYFPLHYNIQMKGMENLPKGKAILAANHTSYLDPVFMITGTGKKIYYLSKHFVAGVKYNHVSPFSLFMGGMGHILLEQENFETRHLKKILALLKKEKYFGIFPEGTRTYDGKIQEFKEGLAEISFLSKAPVVPIALKGCYKIWPRENILPKLYGNVEIIIGKPIPAPENKSEVKTLSGIVKQEMERLYYSELANKQPIK